MEKKNIIGKSAHPTDNVGRQETMDKGLVPQTPQESIGGKISSPADILDMKEIKQEAAPAAGSEELAKAIAPTTDKDYVPKIAKSNNLQQIFGGRSLPTDHADWKHNDALQKGNVVINADAEEEKKEDEEKFNAKIAKLYVDGEIRRRCYFYIPSKSEHQEMTLQGNADSAAEYLKPEFNLKSQSTFDDIVSHSKYCEQSLKGIKSLGDKWTVDYVKDIMKDYHKLTKDAMYKSMVDDLSLVKKWSPKEYEELHKACDKKKESKKKESKKKKSFFEEELAKAKKK